MSDLILYFWLANPFSHFMENKKVVVTNLFLLFTKSSVSASGAGFAPAALLQHQKTNRPNKDQQTNICAVRIHDFTQTWTIIKQTHANTHTLTAFYICPLLIPVIKPFLNLVCYCEIDR